MECQSGFHNMKLLANELQKCASFVRLRQKLPYEELEYSIFTRNSKEFGVNKQECLSNTSTNFYYKKKFIF
jgi:hypothetical protein